MSEHLWSLNSIRLGSRTRPRLEIMELDIPVGVTAVIGQSGAGKTSLLNLLVGFETPDAGSVTSSQAVNIGWVPADFGLWPTLTAGEHLASVSVDSNRSENFLRRFDLSHVADDHPETLSLGERARLAVARSLASGAQILVMDEPFAHVDPGRIDRYWQELRVAMHKSKSSLIFSSHSPHVVLREADHVVCLEDGNVKWSGSPLDLYTAPASETLAKLMGPANWFTSAETKKWTAAESVHDTCVRPEQLALESDDNSQFIVTQSFHLGGIQQTEVIDSVSNESRTLYHRLSSVELAPGIRVTLKLIATCLLVMVAFCLEGCRKSSGDDPSLEVAQSRIFSLPAEGAALPAPRGMTFDPVGRLFVLDDAGRVIVYDPHGNLSRRWWMPEYEVGKPEGAWVLLDGRIAVADTHYHRIVFFDAEGNVLDTLGEFGNGEGQFIYTVAVTQDPAGFLYVAEYGGNDRVQKFTAEGEFVTMFGSVGTEDGQFQRPSGLVWQDDVLYVADAINNRIQAFTPDGKFLRIVADAQTAGLHYPYDLAEGPNGSLFVAEYGAGRISRLSIDGKLLGRYGQEGRGEGQFWTPWGIAVSREGKIAVADTGNRRVVELKL